jgi:hypothetical protein
VVNTRFAYPHSDKQVETSACYFVTSTEWIGDANVFRVFRKSACNCTDDKTTLRYWPSVSFRLIHIMALVKVVVSCRRRFTIPRVCNIDFVILYLSSCCSTASFSWSPIFTLFFPSYTSMYCMKITIYCLSLRLPFSVFDIRF